MHVRQVLKKTHKSKKKNLKKIVKYMGFVLFCFTAARDIHEVKDIKQFTFTPSFKNSINFI